MTQREYFLEVASAGTQRMFSFVEGLVLEVESGKYKNITGSHYSIKMCPGGIINATTRIRGLGLEKYSW